MKFAFKLIRCIGRMVLASVIIALVLVVLRLLEMF